MTEQMEIDNMTSKTVQYVSPINPDFITEANYEMNVCGGGPHVCFITQHILDSEGKKDKDKYDMRIEMASEHGGLVIMTTFDSILIEIDTLNKITDEFKDMVKKVNDMLDEDKY